MLIFQQFILQKYGVWICCCLLHACFLRCIEYVLQVKKFAKFAETTNVKYVHDDDDATDYDGKTAFQNASYLS